MAQIGKVASNQSRSSYSPGHPNTPESGDQYQGTEAQHSPFTDMVQELHAKFITQPNNNNPGELSTPPRITATPEQSPYPSSMSPINTLPSFMDTSTSMTSIVTIEPRPLGSLADNEVRQGAEGQLGINTGPLQPEFVDFFNDGSAPLHLARPSPAPGSSPPSPTVSPSRPPSSLRMAIAPNTRTLTPLSLKWTYGF